MSSQHTFMGQRAYELLPEWEQLYFQEEKENIPTYCDYPDLHLASQWEDPSLLPYYETYCMMDNHICVPHGPVDSQWNGTTLGGYPMDPEKIRYTLNYYFRKILELLRKRERTHCCRFAGVLAHFLQDNVIPVHTANNVMIHGLFPEQGTKYMSIHSLGDSWPFDSSLVTGPVRLLGRTVEEALYHTVEEICLRIEENLSTIVPFFQAVRNGDKAQADRVSQQFNTNAVLLTASVWHTLFSIAFDHFQSGDLAPFRKGRLLTESKMIQDWSDRYDRKQFIDRGIPFYPTLYPASDSCRSRLAITPYPFEPVIGYVFDGKGNLEIPILNIKGEKRSSQNAVCSSAYGIASFRVDATIFRELDVYAGIHAHSVSEKEMTFAVWCHEAADPLLAIGKCSKRDDALHFKVKLPAECRTLTLLTAGADNDLSTVWMDPVLKYRF